MVLIQPPEGWTPPPKNVAPPAPPANPPANPIANDAAKQQPPKNAKPLHRPDAEQPELKKSPPPEVDVAARLADPIRGFEITDVPLAHALDLVASISTLPITLDADALRQVGASPRDHVSVKVDSATVEQVLAAIADQHGLAVAVDNGQVLITTPADFRQTLKRIRYTVSDLTGDDKKSTAQFATLIQTMVAPETWEPAGGRGNISTTDAALVVNQTAAVHQQILVFCEKLRNARHKPLRSRDAPEKFSLTSRTLQAERTLNTPVTANFHEPVPLARILAFLAKTADCDIVIDRAALAAADNSDRIETSLTVDAKPLGPALTDLLRPLGLAYRVIAPNAIQVTTKEAADERLELEFYPVGPQPEPDKLIERIKKEVAPAAWADAGEICFDPQGQCLIVVQSQSVQAQIEQFLATKAK